MCRPDSGVRGCEEQQEKKRSEATYLPVDYFGPSSLEFTWPQGRVRPRHPGIFAREDRMASCPPESPPSGRLMAFQAPRRCLTSRQTNHLKAFWMRRDPALVVESRHDRDRDRDAPDAGSNTSLAAARPHGSGI